MKKITSLLLLITIQQLVIGQNVGIGVPNPAFKLDVGGRVRIKTGTIGTVSTSSTANYNKGLKVQRFKGSKVQRFKGLKV